MYDGGPFLPDDGKEVSFSDAIIGLIAGVINVFLIYWCFNLVIYLYNLIKDIFSFLVGLFN